ncbi:hypothetical protein [Actinacidiphila glaucinigra]|uniref:hypothetical protein n=1 Tax=Actinacidiphila glaucinigra TaxID=235986 RepID=UPI003D8CAA21
MDGDKDSFHHRIIGGGNVMAVHHVRWLPHRNTTVPPADQPRDLAGRGGLTFAAAKVVAGARLITSFVFLWAFLDKTFGFGYLTPPARAARPTGRGP